MIIDTYLYNPTLQYNIDNDNHYGKETTYFSHTYKRSNQNFNYNTFPCNTKITEHKMDYRQCIMRNQGL